VGALTQSTPPPACAPPPEENAHGPYWSSIPVALVISIVGRRNGHRPHTGTAAAAMLLPHTSRQDAWATLALSTAAFAPCQSVSTPHPHAVCPDSKPTQDHRTPSSECYTRPRARPSLKTPVDASYNSSTFFPPPAYGPHVDPMPPTGNASSWNDAQQQLWSSTGQLLPTRDQFRCPNGTHTVSVSHSSLLQEPVRTRTEHIRVRTSDGS